MSTSSSEKIRVAIVGASGYAGGELMRILLGMPQIEIQHATSRRFAGQRVTLAHPNLRGITDLVYSRTEDIGECDVMFLALPHGASMKYVEFAQRHAPRIIDLSADFRLNHTREYQQAYATNHTHPELMSEFVYGLAELHREEIKEARYVACGGCEATCSILALYPLFKEGVVKNSEVIIDAKIGSSASGNTATSASHHPERHGCVRSYKPTGHRHAVEIKQELCARNVHMSATAIEMVRGILTTAQVFLNTELSERDIRRVYRKAYKDEPFIRMVKERQGLYRYPEPKLLSGTNYCDIGFEKDAKSNRLVVIGAIDNLVKGTAGQAVQAMNVMLGWDEQTGLTFSGLHP